MAGETEKYLARIAQDRIPSAEEWQRRAREILELARMKKERRESVPSIWPGNTFRTEPIPQKPNNIVYNTLSDPRLNAGLENLISNASDAIFGRESGNDVVDLGLANAPVIGPASILAAGGVPGIVDVAGMGELRNLKKIPKYTYEFVSKYFGERGLKNLDNALSKYPKAGKPSVNDALYIMKTGIGGEKVAANMPYSSNVSEDIAPIFGYDSGESLMNKANSRYAEIMNGDRDDSKDWAKTAYNRFQRCVESGDAKGAFNSLVTFNDVYMNFSGSSGALPNERIKARIKTIVKDPVGFGNMLSTNGMGGVNLSESSVDRFRLLKELGESPTQDWETIVTKQERKNARNANKSPVVETKQEQAWDPSVRNESFYQQFGRNLSPESKRDVFVVDSLANHWAKQITGSGRQGSLKSADIFDALSRADARHNMSTYDNAASGFREDVKKNIASGNMPGKSVEFGPRFKNNARTVGDTPTLLLAPEEAPTYYSSPRIWADEQEGPDLYELVFRPKADEVLNSINPAYWIYKRR